MNKKHNILFLLKVILITCVITFSYEGNAQVVKVINNKGTKIEVRNNNVTTSDNAPTAPVENDIWFDTDPTADTIIRIHNGGTAGDLTDWNILEHQATPGSVFFAGANGLPTENNTSFTWDDTTSTLNPTNLNLTGTFTDSSGDVGTAGQLLSSTVTGTDWIPNSALNNWLITGNTGTIANTNFLGTIDDVKMQIRSFNIPLLEFGRRQTLGLVQAGRIDYTDPDQPLVFINGDGNTSALQFAASGASFYKPIFFSTPNGSFRMKGSAGVTDLYEIGSAGPSNDGRLEFIIGDDGAEPIIFKRFDYRNGGTDNELFRVQGSLNTADSKTRFGININPAPVPVDTGFDDGQGGFNIANSTFQVAGSVSKSIINTSTNITLTEDHYTVIINGNLAIELPDPTTCIGREYVLKNHFTNTIPIDAFQNIANASQTNIPANTSYTLQSDGANWQLISDVAIATDDQNANEVLLIDSAANFNTTPNTVSVESAFINVLGRFTANNITIADTGGNYVNGNVEAALTEIADELNRTKITQELGNTNTEVTSGDANTIATYTNKDASTTTINETVTSLEQELTTGTLTYTDELNASNTVEVISKDTDNNIVAGSDGGAYFAGPIIYAAGRNTSNNEGTIAAYNATITRTALGAYEITFPDIGSTNYIIQLTPEDCAGNCPDIDGFQDNDEPIIKYDSSTISSTGFTVITNSIHQNPNSGTGDISRKYDTEPADLGFMFSIIKLPEMGTAPTIPTTGGGGGTSVVPTTAVPATSYILNTNASDVTDFKFAFDLINSSISMPAGKWGIAITGVNYSTIPATTGDFTYSVNTIQNADGVTWDHFLTGTSLISGSFPSNTNYKLISSSTPPSPVGDCYDSSCGKFVVYEIP